MISNESQNSPGGCCAGRLGLDFTGELIGIQTPAVVHHGCGPWLAPPLPLILRSLAQWLDVAMMRRLASLGVEALSSWDMMQEANLQVGLSSSQTS